MMNRSVPSRGSSSSDSKPSQLRIVSEDGKVADAPKGYQQTGDIISFHDDGEKVTFEQTVRGKVILYETDSKSLNASDRTMLQNAARAYALKQSKKKK